VLKRALLGLLALLLALALAVGVNTARLSSRQIDPPPFKPVAVDEAAAAASLAVAVRATTVTDENEPDKNAAAFDELQGHLRQHYPLVHAKLKREVVGPRSLLYTWEGSDPKAKPVALMAHQDVVPVAPGTEGQWQVPPFEGSVQDGFVWGRGAWDDKGNLIAELEAVERLLAAGFRPARTVYLIFGADEEIGGEQGVKRIAALLQQRQVRLEYVIDEGLLVTEGIMPGLPTRPVALIGIAEKGFVSVRLRTTAAPGHSSMPPPGGPVAALSRALVRLEAQQMPASIGGVARQMFETVAPELSGFNRVALSNLWLFAPVVQRQLERGVSTNALLRTTTALTIVQAGNKFNVLPGEAQAVVNFRLLPGDSVADVLAHVKRVVDDPGVEIKALEGSAEPSRVSSTDSASYRAVARAVRETIPDAVVAPGLMLGGTDSRYFDGLADNVYRFSPLRARAEDLPRFHGTNERISLKNLGELIRFYHRLLQLTAGAPDATTEGTKP
jgi:carboxypeptidase PM20D1